MRKILSLMLVSLFILNACGLTKKSLGLSKSTPDETKVETRRPLDLPPDFNTLPS